MKKAIFSIMIVAFAYIVFAQRGTLDLSFSPQLRPNIESILGIAVQPDGKILAGINYYFFLGDSIHLTRFNLDGSRDTTFKIKKDVKGDIEHITVQPDGKILAVGGFYFPYQNDTVFNIMRLMPNGDLDSSFIYGRGFNDFTSSLVLLANGSMVIGGNFTNYNGITAKRIIKLLPNGIIDNTFITQGANGPIGELFLQPDGKILIGGDFTAYDNGLYFRMARANASGSKDLSYADSTGATRVLFAIALLPNNTIVVGG